MSNVKAFIKSLFTRNVPNAIKSVDEGLAKLSTGKISGFEVCQKYGNYLIPFLRITSSDTLDAEIRVLNDSRVEPFVATTESNIMKTKIDRNIRIYLDPNQGKILYRAI